MRCAAVLLLAAACAPPQPVPGLDAPVDITTDAWGWPHVSATTLHDAAFAQGYVTAQQRMPQLELFRRTASGRLAERFGAISEQFMESDITMRTLGLRRVAEAMWTELPKGRARDVLEGYAAGVNLHLAELRSGQARIPRGGELLLGPQTLEWTPVDSLAVLRLMELFLSFNADAEIARTRLRDELGPERFAEVYRFAPPSRAVTVPGFYAAATHPPLVAPERLRASLEALLLLRRVLPEENRLAVGTNAWAVAGSHTASGHALLANDPHLPLTSPGMLAGVHLTVSSGPDALDVTGTAFPGVPGVVFGHNARVAWGICNAMFDQMDVYQETVRGEAVLFEGREVPLIKRVERIPNGVFGEKEVEVAVVPHHGPLLPRSREGEHALSVRWVALEPTHEVEGLVALMFARDALEAEGAVQAIEAPGMAFVLADSGGDIAFRMTGRMPVRAAGAQPAFVLPGTGEAEWVGWLPPGALPALRGVPRIVAANNDPAGLSRDGSPFDGPVYLGYDWAEGFRAERIAQRLEALGTAATREDLESIQADTVLLVARRFMPFLLRAASQDEALSARLREWDFDARADGPEAAVFHVWLAHAVRLGFGELDLSPKHRMVALLAQLEERRWRNEALLVDALAAARAELTATFGTADVAQWRWGALHRLKLSSVLPHFSLAAFADLAQGPFERPGGIETVDQGWPALEPHDFSFGQGAARRLTVELTPEGPVAYDALPGGDELELWLQNRSRRLPQTPEEIADAARSQLTLSP